MESLKTIGEYITREEFLNQVEKALDVGAKCVCFQFKEINSRYIDCYEGNREICFACIKDAIKDINFRKENKHDSFGCLGQ